MAAAVHISFRADHGRTSCGQIIQIFEGFGITLANDIRAVIPVEHPDHLPGIAVRNVIAVCCVIVVGDQIADFILVGQQTLIIVLPLILVNNLLRIRCGSLNALAVFRIHLIQIQVPVVRGKRVIPGYGHRNKKCTSHGYGQSVSADRESMAVLSLGSCCFVVPVQFIRAVRHQTVQNSIHLQGGSVIGQSLLHAISQLPRLCQDAGNAQICCGKGQLRINILKRE